ncbi:MAG: hypothetical protein C5B51_15560 [Terriglobia bacterium]|nr:MAG: hypothetical protein C5B51_15560 [Terriglobia bacterium]
MAIAAASVRRALRAAQAVGCSIIRRMQDLNPMLGPILQLLLGDLADAARRAEPQRTAIIHNVGNVVAEKALLGRITDELSVAQRVQAAAERAHPQGSVRILV